MKKRGFIGKKISSSAVVVVILLLCSMTAWGQDLDIDGIADELDNCPTIANSDQKDTAGYGVGDACTVYHCVTNSTELQEALFEAGDNEMYDIVMLQQGTYFMADNNNTGFRYGSNDRYGLFIGGGYMNNCKDRVLAPDKTLLEGGLIPHVWGILTLSSPSADPLKTGQITVEGIAVKRAYAGGEKMESYYEHGGGINIFTNGDVRLNNNILADNVMMDNHTTTPWPGGGLYISSNGSVNLYENTIEGNNSRHSNGGGGYIRAAGNTTLTRNIIRDNMSGSDGGGIYISPLNPSEVVLYDNVISNNGAGGGSYGGGGVCIKNVGSESTLINNVITGNITANGKGGGVNISSRNALLLNNTITNNYSCNDGGGLSMMSSGTNDLYNNIIWGNAINSYCAGGRFEDLYVINTSGTVNVFNNDFDPLKTGGSPFTTQGNNINADPLFVNATTGDYHLSQYSPLRNAGANSAPALPGLDFDGDTRIIAGIVDIGADEYNPLAASFFASPPYGLAPLTVSFTDTSTSGAGVIVSWAWDLDEDGNIDSILRNPAFTYDMIGDYAVSLTVTDSVGNTSSYTGYVIAENDMDGDGISNSSDNCVATYNPVQLDLDADGVGDSCDFFPVFFYQSIFSVGLKSAVAPEINTNDIVGFMRDGILDPPGIRLQIQKGKYRVLSFYSITEASKLSTFLLNVYVSELYKGASQTARIYASTKDGLSVQTSKSLNFKLTPGWNQLDLTPLLHLMDGFGFIKFRITPVKNYFDISEASLTQLADDWEIAVSPSQLDFGQVVTGTSKTLSFNVSNTGKGNLDIKNIVPPKGPFSVTSDNCTGLSLSASSVCRVDVTFSPSADIGDFTGIVTVLSNDADHPSVNVKLSGETLLTDYLKGMVTVSSSGTGLSKVTVTVMNAAKTFNTVTGLSGIFMLNNLVPGAFTAVFEKPGYLTQTINGMIETGQNILLVQLEPVPPPLMVSIMSPSDGSIITSPIVSVSGVMSNSAEVKVNGMSVVSSMYRDVFEITLTLSEGLNTITATASDLYGQTASHSISVDVRLPRPPAISGINVSAVSPDSATVTWTTDQPSDSLVEYGETGAYGYSISDPSVTTSHSLVLSGLKPATTYHFRVTSKNRDNLSATSQDDTFETAGRSFTVSTLGDFGNVTVMEVQGNYDAKNPDGTINAIPRQEIAKEFFKTHNDEYDFAVVAANFDFAMPDSSARAFYLGIKNDTQGIGNVLFDSSALFGSNGRLQGIIDMGNISGHATNPLDPNFETTLSLIAHEQMHRWGAYAKYKDAGGTVRTGLLGKDGTHWSYLLDSDASVLYGNDWQDNKDGTFTSRAKEKYYSPLDLYLMGLYDKSQVPPMLLIENASVDPTKLPEVGATISGTAKYVSIDDIIAAEGERVPNASTSQKTFRMAYILLTTPGTFSANETDGIENIRNAWAGKFSELTEGKGAIEGVAPSITIATASPLNNSVVVGQDIMVKGVFINSTGNETGISVNGIPATVSGSQFIANHVPLTEGTNTIVITATDSAGNTATQTLTVNAGGAGDYIRLTSNMESGISPMEVSLRISGSFSIENSNLGSTGPAAMEVIDNPSPDEYRIKLTTEGIYYVTANVTGPDGNTYQDTISITVLDKNRLDKLLKAKWEGMKGALMVGEIDKAITYFVNQSIERFRTMFTGFSASQVTAIFSGITDIKIDTLNGGIAECGALRTETDGIYSYPVTFVLDENGVWKIMGF